MAVLQAHSVACNAAAALDEGLAFSARTNTHSQITQGRITVLQLTVVTRPTAWHWPAC